MSLVSDMFDESFSRDIVAQLIKLVMDATCNSVAEVDVLRTHEVVRKYTGDIGSLCFVVRRPG